MLLLEDQCFAQILGRCFWYQIQGFFNLAPLKPLELTHIWDPSPILSMFFRSTTYPARKRRHRMPLAENWRMQALFWRMLGVPWLDVL